MQKLKLPAELELARKPLVKALEEPLLAEWPEDEKVADAGQPAAIADALIAAIHKRLTNASIAYVFQKSMKQRDSTTLGKAQKTSAKIYFLTDYDFIVTINWEAWRELTSEQRVALVDHELAHCERDDESGKNLIRRHDVEEFSEVVRRWGLWKPDLEAFGSTVMQLDMFAPNVLESEESLADIAEREASEAERETVEV